MGLCGLDRATKFLGCAHLLFWRGVGITTAHVVEIRRKLGRHCAGIFDLMLCALVAYLPRP